MTVVEERDYYLKLLASVCAGARDLPLDVAAWWSGEQQRRKDAEDRAAEARRARKVELAERIRTLQAELDATP